MSSSTRPPACGRSALMARAPAAVPFIEYGKNHDGVTQAHHLFTALRDLDKHGSEIVYARCPEQDGVSMAVYNRLIRAAAFRVVEL